LNVSDYYIIIYASVSIAVIIFLFFIYDYLKAEKIRILDLDYNVFVKKPIRFDSKSNTYYVKYMIGSKTKRINLPSSDIRKIYVVKNDKLFELRTLDKETAVFTISEVNNIVKNKFLGELLNPYGLGQVLIYIIVGLGIGLFLGYVFNDWNYKKLIEILVNQTATIGG